jgi:hypothetical protein
MVSSLTPVEKNPFKYIGKNYGSVRRKSMAMRHKSNKKTLFY